MKKLSLALALLGLSSTAAYAGGIDYQEPEESGVFMVGLEALYARPHGSDLVYGIQSGTDNDNNVVNKSLQIDSDYQFGYHVDVAYAMPGDGPDVSLGYTNLSGSDHYTKNDVAAGAISDSTARTKSSYDYVDVDLLLGKEFVLQNRYHFHPFAGIRYADIDSKDRVSYTHDGSTVTGEVRNTFDGLGPRVGVDAAIEVANGFSIVARAAGSAIIGDFDWKQVVSGAGTNFNDLDAAGANTYKSSDKHSIVPEADYRLGVNYTHEFSPDTSFGVELGWTTVHYYNAKDKTGARLSSTAGNMSDWGFEGPYFRVQANIA